MSKGLNHGKKWSHTEIEMLERWYSEYGTAIPSLRNLRSQGSIQMKAHELGLTYTGKAPDHTTSVREQTIVSLQERVLAAQDIEGLRDVMRQIVKMATEGDQWAIEMFLKYNMPNAGQWERLIDSDQEIFSDIFDRVCHRLSKYEDVTVIKIKEEEQI